MYPREWKHMRVLTKTSKPVFTTALIHNRPKVEMSQMSVNGWRDEQNVTETYNGVFIIQPLKGTKLWRIRQTWTNLESTMLREESQTQQVTYYISFIWNVQNRQIQRNRQIGRCQVLGQERVGRDYLLGMEFYDGLLKMFWTEWTKCHWIIFNVRGILA